MRQRVLKVWLYVGCLFVLTSALVLGMTAEPKGLYVVAGVTLALGLLGSLMAVLSSTEKRKAASV
jgi:hypothetical protein